MDTVRRGYLGLMLFIAALVLMPLLVVDYHRQTEARADATATAVDGAEPSTAGTVTPTPTPALPTIKGFEGVHEGDTLTGTVQITLDTEGEVGAVTYTLTGYTAQWPAPAAPYLFAPHPQGWDTTVVRNGAYTLTATPVDIRVSPQSVSFQVRN